MEGVVGPQSRLIGRRVADLNLRRLYGAYILAVTAAASGLSGNFDDLRLQMGDTLLLEGSTESMKRLFDYKDLVNLTHPTARSPCGGTRAHRHLRGARRDGCSRPWRCCRSPRWP
jgi:uncharacterized protein with PhoU and TrkA domain